MARAGLTAWNRQAIPTRRDFTADTVLGRRHAIVMANLLRVFFCHFRQGNWRDFLSLAGGIELFEAFATYFFHR